MKLPAPLLRRLHWVNLPGAILVALLQRTPAVRFIAAADEMICASPVGALLKSAAATMASLGAMHSLAGATTLVTNQPSPLSATVGTAIPTVVFAVDGTQAQPGSWEILAGSTLPPGVSFGANGATSGRLTGPGTLNVSNPTLQGTPTAAGTFTLRLSAWELANRGGLESSQSYTYTINVASAGGGGGGGGGVTAPTIASQPVSQVAQPGSNVSFTVSSIGGVTYQWKKNGVDLVNSATVAGVTTTTLTLTAITAASAGSYTAVASNSAGSATSLPATLTVAGAALNPPTITTQPQSVTVLSGTTLALAVGATNATSYQWRINGLAIAGATGSNLIISNVSAVNAGSYTAAVTNSDGTVISDVSSVSVAPVGTPDSRLVNLSVRTNLQTGQSLTVGFVVTNGTKRLLLRAVGPSLSVVGITSGFVADPSITVQNQSGGVLGQNNDWLGDAIVSSTALAVGAFPYTASTSKDAALVQSVSGPATAAISGTGSGIVLVELYDADSAGAAARLINVSARNQVGTAENVLISGFVINGTVAKTVLVRGIGPALKDVFGVNGNLVDPKLELFTQANVKVTENDNWSSQLKPVMDAVGAFAMLPNSKDSAVLVTLPPGVYLAQVSGVNGGTGDGIVEVYVVP